MTAVDPSLRRLSYPLRPGPFSEPSDLYPIPLSAMPTSGTGSYMYRTKQPLKNWDGIVATNGRAVNFSPLLD